MNENQNSFVRPVEKRAPAPVVRPYVEDLEPERLTAEKPKKCKALFIGLGCLLLALLAAGGWWLLNHLRRDPLKDLKLAANKTLDAYEDFVKELPNLQKYTQNARSFAASDDKHVALDLTVNGVPETPDFAVNLRVDRDGSAKKALLQGSYTSGALTLPIDLYLDCEQLQLGSSTLLNEGEALALPAKDFGKKWNASGLAKLTNTTLPDGISLSFLAEGLSEQSMKDCFGSDWSDFVNSVSYEKATEADGTSNFSGQGELYVLRWDQSLLSKLGAQAESMMGSFSANPQTDKLLPAAIVTMLDELGQEMEAPMFLVSDGMLTGIAFRAKDEGTNKALIRIELVGEGNPWARYVMETSRWNAETQKLEALETVECTMTVANGELRSKTVAAKTGSSEPDVMESVYNDADGSFSFSGSGDFSTLTLGDTSYTDADIPDLTESFLNGFNCHMIPVDDGVRIWYDLDLGALSDSLTGTVEISVSLSPTIEPVQPLSKEPTQLLEQDKTSLGILIMRIYSKLSGENPFSIN